jgi:hypothetical protein
MGGLKRNLGRKGKGKGKKLAWEIVLNKWEAVDGRRRCN